MPRLRAPLAVLLALAALGAAFAGLRPAPVEPIRLGVLHAQSGVIGESGRNLVDAIRLAAEQINAAGGVLGRPLELVVADTRSDDAHAAREAERLIDEEGVEALFGCWTSACRKAVLPVVERHRSLLLYPLQYEGMEQSPNVVYLGAAPNQQILPGARWAIDTYGPRIYLLGSDYIYPRTANRLIRDLVDAAGGQVLAERHLPLSATDFSVTVAEIRRLAPDVLLNTTNGAANRHLFAALAEAGLGSVPVVSFSIAEPELQAIGAAHHHPAHHAVWGYFQALPDAANQQFVAAFKARFGPARAVSDPIVASYNSVLLWAAAARDADSPAAEQVNRAIGRTSLADPSGILAIDAATRHLWRRVYLGHARADGQFDVQELSEAPVRPAPFPPYRNREHWLQLVREMHTDASGRSAEGLR